MKLIRGDITELAVDAIVNAANGIGVLGYGVAGAIKRAGGPEIEQAAREFVRSNGPLPAGSSFFTQATGDLKSRYVIHAVTMTYPGTSYERDQVNGLDYIKKSITMSMAIAGGLGIKTIAFPALGTGVGRLPKWLVAKVMFETLKKYEDKFDITICDLNDQFITEVEYYNDKH